MKEKIKGFLKKYALAALLIIGGIVLIGFGVSRCEKLASFKETAATISKIESYYDSDGDLEHLVYVTYTVDGETYVSQYDEYSSTFYEGKSITVRYDPEAPASVMSPSVIPLIIFFGFGVGLTGFGIYRFYVIFSPKNEDEL